MKKAISILFFIFFAELTLFGSGAWSLSYGFSFRKTVFVFLIICLVIESLRRGVIYSRWPILFSLFAIWLISWAVALPIYENTPIEAVKADVSSMIGLIILPLIGASEIHVSHWLALRKWIFFTISISALLHNAIFLIALKYEAFGSIVQLFMLQFFTAGDDGVADKVVISVSSLDRHYVFWASSSILLVGLYIAISNLITKKSTINYLIFINFLMAIYATGIRAFIMLPLVMFIAYYFFKLVFKLKNKNSLLRDMLLVGVLIGITIPVLISIDPSFLSWTGLGQDSSDSLRYEQMMPMLHTIINNPLMGVGIGGSTSEIRSDIAPWSYELSILALIMKIGFVGLCVVYAVCVMILNECKIRVHANNKLEISLLFSFLFGYVFVCNTNPFLFSLIGVGIIFFIFVELNYINTNVHKNLKVI